MIGRIFRIIFDWSEVWALIIPLAVLLIRKPKAKWVTPLKWYLIIALILTLCIDFFWYVNKYQLFDSKPGHRWNNNKFYNLQSIIRLLFFSWFFALQGKGFRHITKIIPIVFLLGTIIFFAFWGDFNYISSYLLASEAGLLLFYCLWYTNKMLREDTPAFSSSHPLFWIVGGLTIFTSVNFFIFLFYDYLNKHYTDFLVSTWDAHNSLFIILCICIAIGLYNERNNR
jgi:hypothetical protein